MTLVSTSGTMAFPAVPRGTAQDPTISGNVLDAQDEAVGWIVQSPVTDTVTKIGFKITNIISGDIDLDIRIETVGADGFPTGTLWGTNTNVTFLAQDGVHDGDFIEVTLTAAASVNRGDIFAIVINHYENNTNSIAIGYRLTNVTRAGFPYAVARTTGVSWAMNATVNPNPPVVSICFGTAGYFPLREIYPFKDAATVSPGNNNYAGNKITVPFKCKVEGFWAWMDIDVDGTVYLIDSDGSTVLASTTVDANYPNITGNAVNYQYFNTDITLDVGDTVYLMVAPTASSIKLSYFDFLTSDIKNSFASSGVVYSSATSPSSSSDYTDLSTRVAAIGLLLKEIDDGSAAGGGGGAINPLNGMIVAR